MITRLKFRHGTTAEWAAFNPTLADGEPGYDSDLKRMKIGDGVQPWSSLNYVTVDSQALTALVNQVDAAVVQAQAAAASAQGTTGREVPGGVAGLDPTGKLYEIRLPDRLSTNSIAAIYNRANHTGTQPSSTLSDITAFGQQVIATASAAVLRGTLQVNLVDNVPDLSKPVSVAQNTAIQTARSAAETLATNRQNHTGTQTASTISDFETAVVAVLSKYSVTFTAPAGGGTTPPSGGGTGGGTTPDTTVPTNVDFAAQADGSITGTWGAPASTGGKTISGYEVSRDQPDWSTVPPLDPSTRSYNLTNFTPGTAYKCGVRTWFTDGSTSNWVYETGITVGSVVVTPPSGGGGGTTTDPGGTTGAAPMPYPAHGIGLYHMIYNNSGYPSVSTTPANVNNLRLAFFFDPGPGPAGTGSDGGNFGAALKALRARGVRIIASFGGSGNSVNMTNTPAMVSAMVNFSNNVCPLDGWDIDLEASAVNAQAAVTIAQSLRTQRGANWITTMAPNGSNIGSYIPVAQALNNAGLLSAAGQQFYDAPVDDAAMKRQMLSWTQANLPISKYEIGMMNPNPPTGYAPASSYWDLTTQNARIASAKAAYPGLGGSYLWERSRSQTAEWAAQVGGTIKTW